MRPEANRNWDCRAAEHSEIKSHRNVSRETETSKDVIAQRGWNQSVVILGSGS